MTYSEWDSLKEKCRGEICLFGAGYIGKNWGYDLITGTGIKVDFYCDNHIKAGTIIKNNIKVKSIEYLYQNRDNIHVFLTVGEQYQKLIIEQLYKRDISKIIVLDYNLLAQILESIDASGDEDAKIRYHAIYDDIKYLEKKFENRLGYKLNLNNPITFNEKLQWLKIYNHRPEYTQMVDKYEVKKYVSQKIGSEYIIPILEVWNNTDGIDLKKLPDKYVLKCTHDAGSVIIVDENKKVDKEKIKKKLNTALGINYFWIGREWPYKNVRRRIIAEKYMAQTSEIIDYKFLCFNGKVRTIFTCSERFGGKQLKVTFFDTDWNRLPFERHYPSSSKKIIRPMNLQLMIELAEILSKNIPFVRIDFYEIENKVYFGEMTFFPGGGLEEFTPQKWDTILGNWIKLPKKTCI